MKKILFSFGLLSLSYAAKADIVVIYTVGKDTFASIQKTKFNCADYRFESNVIGCIDLKSTGGKLGTATTKDGVISDDKGVVLGQLKTPSPDENLPPYKIQESTLLPDGRLMANGVLLGTLIK